MNMYRKYIENLIEWEKSHNRKPLMVWGARQVGKTYLIKEIFAKEYFPNKYIYVDYCMEHVNAKEIIEYLSLDINMVIDKDTVLANNNCNEITVNSSIYAKIIKEDKKYYRGQPIKLLSCSTGKLDNGFAQNLANKLNTIVYAPRTTLWAESDGSYYISESRTGSIREEFRIFYPRKGRSR